MRKPITLTLIAIALVWMPTVELHAARRAAPDAITGTIAYVHNGNEIRLIEPSGSNDRRLWIEPGSNVSSTVGDMAWRPDAAELAFSSNHEQACSLYDSDIYAIGTNGSGLRRITNPPACAGLASFPQGSVTVDVQNGTLSSGFFDVYVQGASSLQPIALGPGAKGTVSLNNVADFGSTLQYVEGIEGVDRSVPLAVDVQAGQNVYAGTMTISGGERNFAMFHPAWRSDGIELAAIFGDCAGMYKFPTYPAAGAVGQSVLNASSVPACLMEWGPSNKTNQVLYYTGPLWDNTIYLATEGSTSAGTPLLSFSSATNIVGALHWLPDGSGFLFAESSFDSGWSSNLYEYRFTDGSVTALTPFTNESVRFFGISPDGQYVVFERAADLFSGGADLWLMRLDGTQLHLLVQNGQFPAWSPGALQTPQAIYLPLLER